MKCFAVLRWHQYYPDADNIQSWHETWEEATEEAKDLQGYDYSRVVDFTSQIMPKKDNEDEYNY